MLTIQSIITAGWYQVITIRDNYYWEEINKITTGTTGAIRHNQQQYNLQIL